MKFVPVTYAYWKDRVTTNGWSHYHMSDEDNRHVFTGTKDYVLVCFLQGSDLDDWTSNFESGSTEVASRGEASLRIGGGDALDSPRTASGKKIFSQWPTEGGKLNLISFNWCDKTTWYENAVRVVDEEASAVDGNYDTYEVANTHLIDASHGKITGEDFLTDANEHSYKVSVKVNGSPLSEVDPHTGAGDYTFDYVAGELTFAPALTSTDTVEVTYHYATDSIWTVKPKPGRQLKIKSAEVQFSEDISLRDTMTFELFYTDPQTGQLALANTPVYYKTLQDYINESNGALPLVKGTSHSSPGWRDMTVPRQIFRWDYQTMTPIKSSAGMELHVRSIHNQEHKGASVTLTLYCLSEEES